ncbi:MAG: hypothetical protein KatS3mg105_1886 [Gemmatales bacterium]|nr:MAG: hypothetical protein KatS3mg105_1886 [Gemmatales bacterium]
MNDFLFMIVYENVRWYDPSVRQPPWFVVVPEPIRRKYNDRLAQWMYEYQKRTGGAESIASSEAEPLRPHESRLWRFLPKIPAGADPAFVLTQIQLGAVLTLLCLWLGWKTYRLGDPETMLHGIFLSLAWGWLLSSAQNPWYFAWCVPFLPFARRRSWYLLTGLVFLYYLRFWFQYDPRHSVAEFDFGWVWLEYGPFFLALLAETCWPRRQ